MVSVIIITYNEELFINAIIDEIEKQTFRNFEILVADGGSTDQTVSMAKKRKVQVLECKKGKSHQINEAAKNAKGEILFFVHADMKFSNSILDIIKHHIHNGYDGGGFDNIFEEDNDRIKRISNLREINILGKTVSWRSLSFYGDNGIFVRKDIFEKLGGFKEIPIMEGYEFSKRMVAQFNVSKIYEPKIMVSARRIRKSGLWVTRFQWIIIHTLYRLGVPTKFLTILYKDVR